ncbi:MAG: serine/threonine protein kinase, partial [Proteobacteria bacterium]|nr:serine/threonine protein kinase [Pseudomonadota bacterium]
MLESEIESFIEEFALDSAGQEALWALIERARNSALSTLVYDFGNNPTLLIDGQQSPDLEEPTKANRYRDLGVIGAGGMGQVKRVLDANLNRTVAMKVIRQRMAENPNVVMRFVEEAQVTSQLQHPGIVAVHELGRLEDGRHYFTMREVRGRTLSEVIFNVHQRRGDGWTFRRLIDAFHKVCEAVAFAHSRDVIHRDLKPDNVMLGEYGDVQVMDWGLAKVKGSQECDALVVTARSQDSSKDTRFGMVAGTPTYMAPEQAIGDHPHVDARSDVYALGSMLY